MGALVNSSCNIGDLEAKALVNTSVLLQFLPAGDWVKRFLQKLKKGMFRNAKTVRVLAN